MDDSKDTQSFPGQYNSIRSRIEREVRRVAFWTSLYGITNEYFYGISWIIAVLTPFGFATILYFPNYKELFSPWALVITAFGTILSLIRSVFRFSGRAKLCEERRIRGRHILNAIDLGNLSKDQLLKMLDDFEQS